MPVKREERWYSDVWIPEPGTDRRIRLRKSLGPTIRTERAAKDAERKLVELYEAQHLRRLRGEPDPLPRAVFSGLVNQWLETRIRPEKAESTYRMYKSRLEVWILPHLGDLLVGDIRRYHLDRLRATLTTEKNRYGKANSPTFVNNVFAVLGALLSYAVESGYLRESPYNLKPLRTSEEAWDYYLDDEVALFLETAQRLHPDWHAFFAVGFGSGARLGELRGLQVRDVDRRRKRLHIQRNMRDHAEDRKPFLGSTKSKKDRWVPLGPQTWAILEAHLQEHAGGPWLFPYLGRAPAVPSTIRLRFLDILAAANLRPIRIHDIRHTYASRLVMAGTPLIVVRDLLGHGTIQQTERYAHLAPDAAEKWVAALEAPVEQPEPDALRLVK